MRSQWDPHSGGTTVPSTSLVGDQLDSTRLESDDENGSELHDRRVWVDRIYARRVASIDLR